MYFITVPECVESLRKRHPEVTDIVVLRPNSPLMPQLLAVPSNTEYIVTVPEVWTDEEKKQLTLQVSGALTSIAINRNTINQFQDAWAENAFWNYETCISAPPIDKLRKTGDYALIVGSGPSAMEAHAFGKPQVFAAWSSPAASAADIIGHCDHRPQKRVDGKPRQGIVLTPVAAKEFVQSFPDSVAYVYFDQGNPLSWRFAEKRGLPDHETIQGNVVNFLTRCAIYAGHTKIKLLGVDLSCKTADELFSHHPTVEEVFGTHNYRGEIVYTDEIFSTGQRGLEELAKRNPEVEFTVLSDQGVILEGIPYEQF
jgi:hypothetical protein